ncbi:MAG: hypothetical protein R6V06_08265 [Kiritimatiellia bacterium]
MPRSGVVCPGTIGVVADNGAERPLVSSRSDHARSLDLRVLGPVEARIDGATVSLGGVRPRTVVAALALGGEVISSGRLIEEVWRSTPPRSATATLQSYLSRLVTDKMVRDMFESI